MAISIRMIRPDDADACGRICYEAFHAIASAHNFSPDFPSPDHTIGLIRSLAGQPGCFGVVAEVDGRIAGSNFLDEGNPIAGVGPITVDPRRQNSGVGVRLMRAVMERSASKGFAGTRLVQAGYHCRSLSLYAKLGFDIREHLSCFQGTPIRESTNGYTVRPATERDIAECNALCTRIHGFARGGDLGDAVKHGAARVVERAGRITAYATQIAFFAHAVGETTDDLKALISAADGFGGPGFLVPSRNGELMRWCLGKSLRITQTMTLMTTGLYSEPQGVWLPSILY